MPELPEVETIACGLRDCLVGQQVVAAHVAWARTVATPSAEAFCHDIVGRRVQEVGRRGKFILMDLDRGVLAVHLRMTGRLLVCDAAPEQAPWWPYVRAQLTFASGLRLYLVDVRKFGRLYLVSSAAEVVGSLGPEPLSAAFTVEALAERLRASRRQLKPLLLDQRVLAGLGNIYVDEALWEARLHPLRRSDTLSDAEVVRLHAAIRLILDRAVCNGGTTLRDYRNVANEAGTNQLALAVYGREGKACLRCGAIIQRLTLGGRGTRLCPVCQMLPEDA